MAGYYDETLAAERLRTCYEIAPPAARAYLEAEIAFVLGAIGPSHAVLELGCGYGRVLARLRNGRRQICGIDTSRASLRLARRELGTSGEIALAAMDALRLAFPDRLFDRVICVQNGISAFHADPVALLREALRVTRPGGSALFSSYADRFWEGRLAWFQAQSAHGLLGEIDREATGNGVIVCKDGFRATTFRARDFQRIGRAVGVAPRIEEVAGSSLFAEYPRRGPQFQGRPIRTRGV